jgi:hypothetical protein
MSLLGQKRKSSERANVFRFASECVAKLFAALLASNNRIPLRGVLNRCCAFGLALESILLILVVKIVLQHIPSESGPPICALVSTRPSTLARNLIGQWSWHPPRRSARYQPQEPTLARVGL